MAYRKTIHTGPQIKRESSSGVKSVCTRCGKETRHGRGTLARGVRCDDCGGNVVERKYA